MSSVVLGYPKISQTDFDWIQSIRKADDRQYEIVGPHVTFVFPTTKFSTDELVNHVQRKASTLKPIKVTLSKVVVIEDDFKRFFHTFLVPSDGYDEIIQLHDVLYSDALLSELREDIPFIPHVGIASNEDKATMQALADKLNAEGVTITGSINALTIAEFDGRLVRDVAELPLKQV